MTDQLVEGATNSPLVVFNYGDPAYRHSKEHVSELEPAENIFLRIISYLAFAEQIAIPARYILESDDVAKAVMWAAPLLLAGLIRPERRVDVCSFEELAVQRGLNDLAAQRGRMLDRLACAPRLFKWGNLSSTYRAFLTKDLQQGGGFRRIITGGVKGVHAKALDEAHRSYLTSTDGTPEKFVSTVARFCPSAKRAAIRWAMARYYTTPVAYDNYNIRELPHSAADLLVKGRALDSFRHARDLPAPVKSVFDRITLNVPAWSIESASESYCEALFRVREEFPAARELFAQIHDEAEKHDACLTLAERFASELARQQGIRPPSGRLYTFMTTLVGGGILAAAVHATVPSVLIGTAMGVVTDEAKRQFDRLRDPKRRPWVLAIDRLDQYSRTAKSPKG